VIGLDQDQKPVDLGCVTLCHGLAPAVDSGIPGVTGGHGLPGGRSRAVLGSGLLVTVRDVVVCALCERGVTGLRGVTVILFRRLLGMSIR
jgi:hypothetical protein